MSSNEYTPEVDVEISELLGLLAGVCDNRDMRVVLAASAHLLAQVVLARNTSLAGVDAFAELFHEQLRADWMDRHDADNKSNGGGEEPPPS